MVCVYWKGLTKLIFAASTRRTEREFREFVKSADAQTVVFKLFKYKGVRTIALRN
jgi:hypothetical protein